jgi:alkanesulfonate monooxygenase SsuD/methylene tetrahydromethanopterin reductase-like flavin-dependent oxidoreductase (luciferase family)
VSNFRLSRPLPGPVPVYLAALRERMLRLAGAEADGVIINWLAPEDVPVVLREVRAGAERAGRDPAGIDVVCRIFVCVVPDPAQTDAARTIARRTIGGYLNVPVYAAFHEWLGNRNLFGPMWEKWNAGDRRGAVAALSDEAVDSVFIVGDADYCRKRVRAYVEHGVTTPVIYNMPISTDWAEQGREVRAAVEALAPR